MVFHLKFTISLSSGKQVEQSLYEGNVVGTRNLLEAAANSGVSRVVVSSSSLTVGLNHEPQPLDEGADWDRYAFNLPYALSRRQAEQEALSRSPGEPPEIVVVNPSFTLGPEDLVGAPANGLGDEDVQARFPAYCADWISACSMYAITQTVCCEPPNVELPVNDIFSVAANVTSDKLLRVGHRRLSGIRACTIR